MNLVPQEGAFELPLPNGHENSVVEMFALNLSRDGARRRGKIGITQGGATTASLALRQSRLIVEIRQLEDDSF